MSIIIRTSNLMILGTYFLFAQDRSNVPPVAGAHRVKCPRQGEVWLRLHDLRLWEDCT
jgi:hypothetical protein